MQDKKPDVDESTFWLSFGILQNFKTKHIKIVTVTFGNLDLQIC